MSERTGLGSSRIIYPAPRKATAKRVNMATGTKKLTSQAADGSTCQRLVGLILNWQEEAAMGQALAERLS